MSSNTQPMIDVVKCRPEIVTAILAPEGPDEGKMSMTTGCSMTSNKIPAELNSDPSFETSKACIPGVAAGVVQCTIVEDSYLAVTAVQHPNLQESMWLRSNPAPLIVMMVSPSSGPLDGKMLTTVGAILKTKEKLELETALPHTSKGAVPAA